MTTDGFIPPHGGYRNLKAYQKAEIIYDATLYFCRRFFSHNRRQTDQMEQAARSGKQNIAEGSLASATSKQTEIHLTNVARASLGELLEDYNDFLRTRHLPIWDKHSPPAQRISALAREPGESIETYRAGIESVSPEVSANTIRHLVLQANLLLDGLKKHLEQDFLRHGGIRERMTAARLRAREATCTAPVPSCPECGANMVSRKAHTGPHAGRAFWGCSRFPDCRGIREATKETPPVEAPSTGIAHAETDSTSSPPHPSRD